jgi:hypothetical protein
MAAAVLGRFASYFLDGPAADRVGREETPTMRALAFVSFAMVVSSQVALAQDKPARPTPPVGQPSGVLRPVPPGVQRRILTVEPRTDVQLAALLRSTRARRYTVYSFQRGTRSDRGRVRHWSGVLAMPRTPDLGPLTDLAIGIPGGPKLLDRWHRHADGTWSKIVLNRAGESAGVLSINRGWFRAALDLDGDGLIDVLDAVTLDGRETVIASLDEGATFLERWLVGDNMLCDPRSAADRPGSPSLIGTAGTLESCAETGRRDRGPLAGITPSKPESPRDPASQVCEGRTTTRGTAPLGVGPRTDDGAVAGFAGWLLGKAIDAAIEGVATVRYANAAGVFLAITLEPSTAGASPCELAGSGACAEQHAAAGDDEEAEDVEGAREAPDVGADGVRGGDPEAALDTFCTMRARAQRRWAVTLEQLEAQSAGKTDTDCDDPVTDPAAADAAKTLPKCGPSRDTRSVTEQLLTMLGAYKDRQCGPTERPGPDGDCRGGRNLPDGTGRLWYGYGDVIGLVPCEGMACDPRETP